MPSIRWLPDEIVVGGLQSSNKARNEYLATSRFTPEIVDRFKDSESLEIRASSEDVERYLEGHIEQLPTFVQRNRELQEEIKTGISAAVDGMYVSN